MQLITDITKSTMPTSITPPPPPTFPYTLYSPNRDLSRLPPPPHLLLGLLLLYTAAAACQCCPARCSLHPISQSVTHAKDSLRKANNRTISYVLGLFTCAVPRGSLITACVCTWTKNQIST